MIVLGSSSPQIIVDMFAEFFESVYEKDTQINLNELEQYHFPSYDIKTFPVTASDILNAISTLKESGSSGPDGIPPIFLKNCSLAIVEPITTLFNWSLQSGLFPTRWKSSFIMPIFKAGRRNDI